MDILRHYLTLFYSVVTPVRGEVHLWINDKSPALPKISCSGWDPWDGPLCPEGTHLWNGHRQAPSASWHSHGCLLSSQSLPAPSLPTFSLLFMQELEAVGISSQGSGRHLLRRPQFYSSPVLTSKVMKRHSKSQWRRTPSFFPRGITEQRLLSENVLISKQHNDLPPPPQHALLKDILPEFVEVPECSKLRCISQALLHLGDTTYSLSNSTGSLLIEHSLVETVWSWDVFP